MLQLVSWPNSILHLDGDAFFASVMQAINPVLRGKPLAVGKERGIATAVSYQAKALGVKRGMRDFEIKRIAPQCLFLESDYEIYDLFSQKMFSILHSFSPWVEEYSVDEGFADLKGLRRPYRASYYQIGKMIKDKIETSLGITVSVGISLTKSLAKLASSSQKPSGLTVVDGPQIERLLREASLSDIWGVGENTAAYLTKLGLKNALDFASKPETFIKSHLTKPYLEIWHELRGEKIYQLNLSPKTVFKSISKSQTFKPPTSNPQLLWAKLLENIEQAFQKARRFNFQANRITIFLKTQQFHYHTIEIKLLDQIAYPLLIRNELKKGFATIYQKDNLYRATGCYLTNLQAATSYQPSLFSNFSFEEKAKKIYPLYEAKKVDFGTLLFDSQKLSEKKQPTKTKIPLLKL